MTTIDNSTELRKWDKAVLGKPNPADFGIPKEYCEDAQRYATYAHENKLEGRGIIRNFDFIGFDLLEGKGLMVVISETGDGKRGVFTIRPIDAVGSGVRYE